MFKSDPYIYFTRCPERMLVLMNCWPSPVGSTMTGHDGANTMWKRVSQITDSGIMLEWMFGSSKWFSPYSLRIDLKTLVCAFGFRLFPSVIQSLLHVMPCTPFTKLTISFRSSIRSSEEKNPSKQTEAARIMQSPVKA